MPIGVLSSYQQSKQKVNFHNYVAQIEKTLFHVT